MGNPCLTLGRNFWPGKSFPLHGEELFPAFGKLSCQKGIFPCRRQGKNSSFWEGFPHWRVGEIPSAQGRETRNFWETLVKDWEGFFGQGRVFNFLGKSYVLPSAGFHVKKGFSPAFARGKTLPMPWIFKNFSQIFIDLNGSIFTPVLII